jgi:hypothetical protein
MHAGKKAILLSCEPVCYFLLKIAFKQGKLYKSHYEYFRRKRQFSPALEFAQTISS